MFILYFFQWYIYPGRFQCIKDPFWSFVMGPEPVRLLWHCYWLHWLQKIQCQSTVWNSWCFCPLLWTKIFLLTNGQRTFKHCWKEAMKGPPFQDVCWQGLWKLLAQASWLWRSEDLPFGPSKAAMNFDWDHEMILLLQVHPLTFETEHHQLQYYTSNYYQFL